jgi:transcriptional regulator with XRE-family HTH domain
MTLTLDHNAIGRRCAVLRQRAGLNEREAARRAGLDPRTWRDVEHGRRFQTDAFLKICHAFRCSADWLATGEGRWP